MVHTFLTLFLLAPIGISCKDYNNIVKRLMVNETVTPQQRIEIIDVLNETFPNCPRVETDYGNY